MSRKKSDISKRLNFLKLNLSLREFAKRLNISTSTLWEYMNGRTPPADFIVRVCDRFDVSESWLLKGKGPIYKNKDKKNQGIIVTKDMIDEVIKIMGKKDLLKSPKMVVPVNNNIKEKEVLGAAEPLAPGYKTDLELIRLYNQLVRIYRRGDEKMKGKLQGFLAALDPGEKEK